MIKKMLKYLKEIFLAYLLKRCIKQADKAHETTKCKYVVVRSQIGYEVLKMQDVRRSIKSNHNRKELWIQFQKSCVYSTI